MLERVHHRCLPRRARARDFGRLRLTWSYGYPGRRGIGVAVALLPPPRQSPVWTVTYTVDVKGLVGEHWAREIEKAARG